jgi:hypothetical protein
MDGTLLQTSGSFGDSAWLVVGGGNRSPLRSEVGTLRVLLRSADLRKGKIDSPPCMSPLSEGRAQSG